ncbi:UVH3 [Ecytonucleospora hepatopenaei]|uniref:Exonuclease I n=1 Tax=Ecytonucleospora hepatopenaei TaxID=646526 RepID=A0A1W0E8L7_9MICR|nr:exonuclease I [Ecytonucleospora hepatopenaei]OQS55590.1 UVH3 [Ecytonucleospora hepatopenaei]
MGVKNLWKLLKPFGKHEEPKDMKIAIDSSIWLNQVEHMTYKSAYVAKKEIIIKIFINRILRLLHNGIDPIFIFDGSISRLKMETILKRRETIEKAEEKRIFKGILENKTCTICNKPFKKCDHGVELKKELIEKLDEEVFKKIEENEYDWGDRSTETENEEENNFKNSEITDKMIFSKEYAEPLNKEKNIQDFSYIDELYDLTGLDTTSKKIKKLNDLRENRKLPMYFDDTNDISFVKSQLENVKKRNKLNELINQIEGGNRVQSDCRILSEFLEKEKINREYQKIKKSEENLDKNVKSNFDFQKYDTFLKKFQPKFSSSETLPENLVENKKEKNISSDVRKYLKEKYEIDASDDEDDILTKNPIVKTTNSVLLLTLIEILNNMNIRFIASKQEADTQCIGLFKDGVVDGVISEDNDIFVGQTIVYKNYFSKNKHVTKYDPCEIFKSLMITQEQLILMSILIGSDYCEGIKNIGPKKALLLVKEKTTEDILNEFDVEKEFFIQLKHIYKDVSYKKIKGFKNGKIHRGNFLKFLEEKNVEPKDIMFNLDKINRFQ